MKRIPNPTKDEIKLYDDIVKALFSHAGWENVAKVDQVASELIAFRRERFGVR